MRYRLLFTICVGLAASAHGQKARDYRNEAGLLKKVLWDNHIQPPALDDRFSKQVFDLFIESLDPDKLYFTEADLAPLRTYQSTLDDELSGKSWNFLKQVFPVYKRGLERAAEAVQQITQTAFTGEAKEYFRFDTLRWPQQDKESREYWRLWLKYQTFDRLADLRKGYTGAEKDFFTRHEPLARERVRSFELRTIKRILNNPHGFENHVADAYLQTIAAVFDAHTVYLPSTEMENFLSALSTEGYYFGLTLDESERGDVLIAALAPGGPAWKSGELHVNDVVENLQWEGQEAVSGISLDEANDILADANHHTMEFTVRKASGLSKTVKLRKEKISVEENFVRSYILAGKYKVGYISLPDFYTQWGDESEGSRCANDVAKEIMKLRKENIDGLVLDVRHNGGGSLQEAIALAGIFLDEGPLGLLKDKQQHALVLKDIYRGTVYDGPLVIQVNGQSASASEFLAGALQDYNRAVVVGGRTFGKATAQNFFPLNPLQKGPSLDAPTDGPGYAGITTDKIYRVTGRTVQGHGVTPDVTLPDVLDALNMHEASMPFALRADSVTKRTYYKPLKTLPLVQLKQQSEKRLTASSSFQQVNRSQVWLFEQLKKKNDDVLLSWTEFDKEAREHSAFYKNLEESLTQTTATFEVANTVADNQRMAVDDYAKDFNNRWIINLKKDMYVEEAFRVITDLIDLNRTVTK